MGRLRITIALYDISNLAMWIIIQICYSFKKNIVFEYEYKNIKCRDEPNEPEIHTLDYNFDYQSNHFNTFIARINLIAIGKVKYKIICY